MECERESTHSSITPIFFSPRICLPAYLRYEIPKTTLQWNKSLFKLGEITESGLHESEKKMFVINELGKISVLPISLLNFKKIYKLLLLNKTCFF